MITFEQYIDYKRSIEWDYENSIDEGKFFPNLWQKAKSAYKDARGNPEDDTQLKDKLEGWSNKVTPHIAKASQLAGEYADKLKISKPLATAIILSGILGGPAAIPMSVIMYYVNKPVGKFASQAFDKGVQAIQGMTNKNQTAAQSPVPTAQPTTPAMKPVAPTGKPMTDDQYYKSFSTNYSDHYHNNYDFNSYVMMRDLQEGYVGDKIKQYAQQTKQWWDEKGSDQVSGAIGKGLGFVAGKAVKYSGNISHLITSSFSSMAKWASENKLPIAKTMFLMSVGAATGVAVGATVNFVAAKALALSKTVKPEEVNDWLKENFKMEIKQDENGNYEVYGDQHYTSTGAKPHHTEVGDYIPDQYVTSFKDHIKDVTDGLTTDTFTKVNFSKLIDKSIGPDVMGLQFNATITPQAGESVKDVLNRAYQSLKDNLAEKGFTADIEQFKQISAYANKGYYPDQPIQVSAIIKPEAGSTNLIGGAIGGAVGAKTGSK